MDLSFLISEVNKLKGSLTAAQYYLEAISENEAEPGLISKARSLIEEALEFTLPEPYLQEMLGNLYMKEGHPLLAYFMYLEAYNQTRDKKLRGKLVESWMQEWKQSNENWSPIEESIEMATAAFKYGAEDKEELLGILSEPMKDSGGHDNLMFYGDLLVEAGEPEAAVEIYEKAYRLSPMHEGAARRLIGAYVETGNWGEADRVYDRLREHYPDVTMGDNAPGVLMAYRRMEEGRYLEAARYMEREVETVYRDKVLLETLEEIYAHTGEYDKAREIRSKIETD